MLTHEPPKVQRTFAKRQRRMSDAAEKSTAHKIMTEPEEAGETEEIIWGRNGMAENTTERKDQIHSEATIQEVVPVVPTAVVDYFRKIDNEKLVEEDAEVVTKIVKTRSSTPVTTGGSFVELQRSR